MRWLWSFFTSSIGAKVIMALTGSVLVLFILGHMVGNLQVFIGQDALNTYAHFLQSKQGMLWVVRGTLLAFLILHVWSSARLTLDNRAARPVSYQSLKPIRSTFTSRNMFVTGFMVLAFLTYHLLHFTVKVTNPEYGTLVDSAGRPDVYGMVVLGFSQPLIAGTYIVAMVLLGLHLSHAISSTFQSLGINTPKWFWLTDKLGPVVAVIVVVGNLTMPVAALAGRLPLPGGVN
jgi:succinate dehydrogenase / fumarate reductase cytochrome b subunit